MKKLIVIAAVLSLSACSFVEKVTGVPVNTPEAKYYAVNVAAIEAANGAKTFKAVCKLKTPEDGCHAKIPLIDAGLKALASNMDKLDETFKKNKQSADFNLMAVGTENTATELKEIVGN